MERVAVFVDAGYLFARGGELLGSPNTSRQYVSINLAAFKEALESLLRDKVTARLLRVYWYDGLPVSGNMSSDQSNIALTDDFKLRLGQVNGLGKQKGVDSMIVTDMIELARNKGISDAVLLGGDDDLRVGVQVTQTFGVRVHVIGFGSDTRHANLNKFLRQEADTSSTWEVSVVRTFITVTPPPTTATALATTVTTPVTDAVAAVSSTVDEFVAALDRAQLSSIDQHRSLNGNNSVPSDIDRALLKAVSTALGGPLDTQQKRDMRRRFNERVNPRLPTA